MMKSLLEKVVAVRYYWTVAGVVAVGFLLSIQLPICSCYAATPGNAAATVQEEKDAIAEELPKLLDLGATRCIPCKRMAPILEELKAEYVGIMDVEFIDVWQKENAAKAQKYGIESIPTQIFFAAGGKELWRHEGYISREDILAKWKALGYDFVKLKKDKPVVPDAK